MARSRRRGSFRRRPAVDWVQNDIMYSEQYTSIAPGQPNAVAGVLVHSAQCKRTVLGAGGLPVQALMSAAVPQWEENQIVRAVRGTIEWHPSESWSTSQVRHWGFRIAKFVEDPDSLLPMVPIDYNMYGIQPGPLPGDEREPYLYADDRFLWERRVQATYQTISELPLFTVPVKWSGFCKLEEDECLAMYMEGDLSAGDSGAIRARTWLRSLVQVPTSR